MFAYINLYDSITILPAHIKHKQKRPAKVTIFNHLGK